MPTNAPDTSNADHSPDMREDGVACPLSLTPPPDLEGDERQSHVVSQDRIASQYVRANGPLGDNTATGMSMWQEHTLYGSSGPVSEKAETDALRAEPVPEEERIESVVNNAVSEDAGDCRHKIEASTAPDTPISMRTLNDENNEELLESDDELQQKAMSESQRKADRLETDTSIDVETNINRQAQRSSTLSRVAGVVPVDKELDQYTETKNWDFSNKRLSSVYPSSLFQAFSKYKGTQQSDKQMYNVEVTILTVDIEQSTLSGYLQICGLTPDHPTLTTFFTGEIIGGPDQKYSFRTSDPDWGANSKIDVTHWTRFPAWKPLSSHAKKDINFSYPLNHESWWQQEHVFMRWKEHFLVPDHKLRSIQGASFEGFYYICLNQVEGKISGIYFHYKSEKYQQLELKHEGKQGAWGMGVRPSLEFR